MKIDLGPQPVGAFPDLRPFVVFRSTRWGAVAQAGPRRRKASWSARQEQYRARFAFAARMAAAPFVLDYKTAVEMAKGTEQVPRDILTMAATGTYYILVNEDGSEWGHVPNPTEPL